MNLEDRRINPENVRMNHRSRKPIYGKRWRLFFSLAIAGLALAQASPSRATTLADFAQCISNSGAIFYGATWCPYCAKQRKEFGDAASLLPYRECYKTGTRKTVDLCDDMKINSYPTWIFADGSRARGKQSFADLSRKTGCPAP